MRGWEVRAGSGEGINPSNNAEECSHHRTYTNPIYSCWFTDFIYEPDFSLDNIKNKLDDIRTLVAQIKPENIPIKPYHPYFAKMRDEYSYYEMDDTISNKDAVLGALNAQGGETTWADCESLEVLRAGKYEKLLCPVLTGERYTGMNEQ